jgi:hypothetical protein
VRGQPAGRYTVVTDEEELPGLSFSAHRRVATLIVLPAPGGGTGGRVANIDPLELQAAQETDAEPTAAHRCRAPPLMKERSWNGFERRVDAHDPAQAAAVIAAIDIA